MSATVNVILAAGPSLVALAALGSTLRQQNRGFRHQREMSDLTVVRELLDDAAIALHRASLARDGVWAVGPAAAAEAEGVASELANTGTGLDAIVERLMVRLGLEARVVLASRAAADALKKIHDEIHRPNSDSVDQFGAFHAASDEFNAARAAFRGAAADAAGAQLPQPRRRRG
jgi:hypothetical protein